MSDEELTKLKEQMYRQQRVQSRWENARRSLNQELARLDDLRAELHKEGRDVERLEGLSIQALFHTILRSKEEQLDQERQEFLGAQLKYAQCQDAIQRLNHEVEALESELASLQGVEARYQELLRQKEQELIQSSDSQQGERGRQLLRLLDEQARVETQVRETQEALTAGREVQKNLELLLDSLHSAGNWGTFDMLGGGLLATAVKHSRMDDARTLAHEAQHGLRRFERELQDIQSQLPGMEVDVSGFLTFADYFMDGLIMDWVVQSRIRDAQARTQEVYDRVSAILPGLEKQLTDLLARVDHLRQEKQNLIEG